MDGERRYKQRGYMESERERPEGAPERPRQPGPRLPIDVTGPRLPRMVQSVTAARCFNCSTTLPADTDFKGNCPKCAAALHCCKQCAHFEPSTRFQCLKPIPARIAIKDQANECEWFVSRVTVARDAASSPGNGIAPAANVPVPRSAQDARAAFDQLFKK